MRFIDLSHPLRSGDPAFPNDPKMVVIPHGTIETHRYNISQLVTGTHQGTHLDAMRHFYADGRTIDEMPLDPLPAKWIAFGWRVQEIDGHDLGAIVAAIAVTAAAPEQPHMIICDTVKGKGVSFIRIYGSRIAWFHVKDAEFRPDGRGGVYGGYLGWAGRAGRFRSLGDGQVDFRRVFTLLTEAGYRGWAVLEWECCLKSSEQGAREGAPFIGRHLIEATAVAFDDFAGGKTDPAINRRILGLD